MNQIDVTKTWHLNFLHFMGYRDDLYRAYQIDSCTYVKFLIRAAVVLVFLTNFLLIIPAIITWSVIVGSIFMYFGIFLTPEMILVGSELAFFIFSWVLLLMAFAVSLIFGISGLIVFLQEKYRSHRYSKLYDLPKEPSAIAQLYDSFKNKYCVPVKIE